MNLDRLVHSPARLAIFVQLMVVDRADATWLQQQTGLSWGNLATHVRKLEQAGYLLVGKDSASGRERTFFELSPQGRAAYKSYRKMMMGILK